MSEVSPKKESSEEAFPESWATFRHPTLRFSLRYPSDWKPTASKDSESSFAVASASEQISLKVFAYPWEIGAGKGYYLLRHVLGYSDEETVRQMVRWADGCERLLEKNPDNFVRLTEFLRGEADHGARLTFRDGSITHDCLIFKQWPLFINLSFDVSSSEYEATSPIFEKIAHSLLTFPDCWYCGRRPAEEVAADEVQLYRLKGISSKHNNKRIEIPRCSPCKVLHERGSRIEKTGGVIGVVAGIILMIGFSLRVWPLALLMAAIGFGIGRMIGLITARKANPHKEVRNYPEVREKISDGWKMYADEHHYG